MGKPTPPPTYKEYCPIVGDMIVGSATIRYSHCAERVRRHFQIDVYKTYERTTLLGTIEEVKEPPPRIRNMKKKVLWAGGRGGGGGNSEKNEAPTHTIKKSLHPAAEGEEWKPPFPLKLTILKTAPSRIFMITQKS